MNLIKFFRKPHLALLLALLLIFSSCSQYEYDNIGTNLNLEDFAERHIDISSKVIALLNEEKNIDIHIIKMIPPTDDYTKQELNKVFEISGIKESTKLVNLFSEMNENAKNYVRSNPYSDLEIIEESITSVLDKKSNDLNFALRHGDCEEERDEAYARCDRNYVISVGVAVVSAFYTFGVGTLLAGVTALLIWADCTDAAWHNYRECIGEE